MLDIEIDGKQVQVPPGSTVMDAARALGTYIPHFCYHKKLSIAANCRMCLVQVEKAPKPMPACATPVANGMKVFTHSELAVAAQKGVMEFLLINHPLDCPICDQGGECQLQDIAVGYGGAASRYKEAKHVVLRKDVGPLISMQEMSRCIHCTRCVRFGREIAGVMELGMTGRNVHSEIQTFVGRSVDSELSGNMIDLCPVGALTSRPFRYSARSWELSRRKSVSPHDSLGTNLTVQVKNNSRVLRVLSRENEEINECWISDKDRFSYEALNSPDRLEKPMIRVDGALREVEWNVALDYVAHALKDVAKNHGAESIAALSSPHSTVEELYLMQKLMRGLGSGNVDFRPRRKDFSSDEKRAGTPWLGMRLGEIGELGAALVVGSFLRKDHPLFAQRLRQLARKGGKVSVVSVTGDDSLIDLHAEIAVAPRNLTGALAGVVKAAAALLGAAVPAGLEEVTPCAQAERIAASLALAEDGKKAIFLGNVAEQVEEAGQLHALGVELARLTGARLGFIGEAANSVGGYVAGALPGGSGLNAYRMFEEARKAYFLLGVEPEFDCANPQKAVAALKQAEFVTVMTLFRNEAAAEYADALLPLAAFTETSGTYVNTEGRVQSVQGACRPRGEARPGWKVLRVLGKVLSLPGFDYESSEAVRDEVIPAGAAFVENLDNGVELPLAPVAAAPVSAKGLERIADVPIHFADALVRRAPALQRTRDAAEPIARIHPETLDRLALVSGAKVRVTQEQGEAILTVRADAGVPLGCVRVAAAHAATAALGDMFGPINVERA
ncbi:MAG: NADH-quinone oxidoreductase subunit NuoG [Candidatus Accumulibacter sp.]|jgi:NADH-quinone oxidoreductase subunit G|nr:NADH-quinone oxidoreductase subunit NuoG [Accumulibacter sp.]